MILDSEVLLIDNKTGKPLPFGTLGVHKVKKKLNKNALLCLKAVILLTLTHSVNYHRVISELWCLLEHLGGEKIPEKADIEKLLL